MSRARAALALSWLAFVGCARQPCRTEGASTEACIPGGVFVMGHDSTNPAVDWRPAHEIRLSPFFLDRTEVTWARYSECAHAGACGEGGLRVFPSTRAALDDPERAQQPAASILWAEAAAYCAWRGQRLPTEAEWERAARGPSSSSYPWGEALPSAELLHAPDVYPFDPPAEFPPVGSNTEDVSEEGVHDLFASLEEWVADWHGPYSPTPVLNPTGPSSRADRSVGRVTRGEHWSASLGPYWDFATRGTPGWVRGSAAPNTSSNGFGFRCARDDQPAEGGPLCPEHHCPEVVAAGQGGPHAIRVADGVAYWTNSGGEVGRADPRGTTVLATSPEPRGLAVSEGFVYWLDRQDATLRRVRTDGGSAEVLATDLTGAYDGLQVRAGAAYWCASGLGVVEKLPLDGGARVVMASGQQSPVALAVTEQGLAWTTAGLNGRDGGTLTYLPFDGGVPAVLARGLSTSFGLALDATSAYWTDYWQGTINRVELTGGATVVLASGQQPRGIALHDGFVYWTDEGDNAGNDGAVERVPISGGKAETLAWFQLAPRGLVAESGEVWWVTHTSPAGRVLRLNLAR